jgi:hypothetical protein
VAAMMESVTGGGPDDLVSSMRDNLDVWVNGFWELLRETPAKGGCMWVRGDGAGVGVVIHRVPYRDMIPSCIGGTGLWALGHEGHCWAGGTRGTQIRRMRKPRTQRQLPTATKPAPTAPSFPLLSSYADDDLRFLRLYQRLGSGGAASVYAGVLLGMDVAVKVIEPPPELDMEALASTRADEECEAEGAEGEPQDEGERIASLAAAVRQAQMRELVRSARECAVLTTLSHPAIVQVRGAGAPPWSAGAGLGCWLPLPDPRVGRMLVCWCSPAARDLPYPAVAAGLPRLQVRG